MADTQLGKFEFSDGRNAFCLLFPCKPNTLDIKVLVICGDEAWRGVLTEDELRKQALSVETDAAQFRKIALGALGLTVPDFENRENLQCEIANGRLTWKKSVADQGVRYKLGSIDVQRENVKSAIEETLFSLVKSTSALRAELADSTAANRLLAADRDGAVRRLENLQGQRDEAEKELFEKFAAILNEKKKEIRRLRQELERRGEDNRTDSPEFEKADSPPPFFEPSEASSGSSTEIDEDPERTPVDPAHGNNGQNNQGNNSLMLDDDQDGVVITKKARTRVRAPRNNPGSPVPSTSTATASELRPSRRARRPQRSVDADDLLDEI